ncbi:amidohydrolase/deacetylase family metallohydrolase [Fusibacter ferrireducens]|uniref:Amidohydrolase/deacetylase family metallohydrolase n=1 Tax=Fusibacter ferrireducens TaxID=2785058 RepID=A0ABR9ZW95_9FIRM|nr:amidohydrolase/deacetylase family metallohydrolase [Fusibacter ferrireducens]MBF4694734.1 amidohydrolase/deacetylase family metallohydrolase [Fusibacter ferrireducens]
MKETILIQHATVICEGHPLNGKVADIYIEAGKIRAVGEDLTYTGPRYDATGKYVSPGFIDAHVHCYHGKTAIGISPDDIGVRYGVTTLIDAGTSGADTLQDFKENIIDNAVTRVLVLLNVATSGLLTLNELADPEAINAMRIREALEQYGPLIVGLKARASSSVLGTMGITPIQRAAELAQLNDLPLVVHIGNAPPDIETVVDSIPEKGIITHMYHNKPNGLFTESGSPKLQTSDARQRQVKFDVGHGSSSFSFEIAEKAIRAGFEPDMISSDLYDKNRQHPVRSLVRVMNKLLASGMSVDDCIACVTTNVKANLNLKDRGDLSLGALGDLTIFELEKGTFEWEDSVGDKRMGTIKIKPVLTVLGGTEYQIDNGGL